MRSNIKLKSLITLLVWVLLFLFVGFVVYRTQFQRVSVFQVENVSEGNAYRRPLSGHNVTRYDVVDNSLSGTSLIWEYQEAGVRDFIKSQLNSMHSEGTEVIRIQIPNMHNFTVEDWGVVPSNVDALPRLVQENLAQYFTDIRDSGISTLIVVFSPVGANQPRNPAYDSSLIEENFKFIEMVRPIAVNNGPEKIYFDLANEIAPYNEFRNRKANDGSNIYRNIENYISEIWAKYVKKYGYYDASFTIVKPIDFDSGVHTNSADNLLTALEKSGKQTPLWYPVNIYAPSKEDVYDALSEVDLALSKHGIGQEIPIMVTESYLNDYQTANGIKRFIMSKKRPITHYVDWFKDKKTGNRVALPFSNSAYNVVFSTSGDVDCDSKRDISSDQAISTVVGVKVKNGLFSDDFNNSAINLCVSSTISNTEKFMNAWSTNYVTDKYETGSWLRLNKGKPSTFTFTLYQSWASGLCKGKKLDTCEVNLY